MKNREKRALELKKEGKSLDEITEILISENLVSRELCSPKERTRQIICKAERLARKNQNNIIKENGKMRTIYFKNYKFVCPEVKGYFVELLPIGEASRIYWVRDFAEAENKIHSCEWFNAIRGKKGLSSSVIYTDDTFERVAVYNPMKKEARWSLAFRDGTGTMSWQAFASLV